MENLEKALPIIAYPILSTEGGKDVSQRANEAQNTLNVLVGIIPEEEKSISVLPDNLIAEVLESELGAKPIDISDLIKDM